MNIKIAMIVIKEKIAYIICLSNCPFYHNWFHSNSVNKKVLINSPRTKNLIKYKIFQPLLIKGLFITINIKNNIIGIVTITILINIY